MDHISRVLSRFGLTESEAKIYRQVLLQDDLSPFKLSQLTNIPRTTIYEILMNLSLKGLVRLDQSDGFTKQQTRVRAHNPSILRQIVHQKRDQLSRLDVDLVDILPSLKGDYHRSNSNSDFQFFPGIDGAKKIYFSEYTTVSKSPIWAFENLMPMDAFGKQPINKEIDQWLSQHLKTSTEVKEIVGLTPWAKHVLSYQYQRDSRYMSRRQIRYIDDPSFLLNQRIVIHADTVKISTIHQDESWGARISSPSLASTLSSIFQFVWNHALPLTDSIISSWGPNEFLQAETW